MISTNRNPEEYSLLINNSTISENSNNTHTTQFSSTQLSTTNLISPISSEPIRKNEQYVSVDIEKSTDNLPNFVKNQRVSFLQPKNEEDQRKIKQTAQPPKLETDIKNPPKKHGNVECQIGTVTYDRLRLQALSAHIEILCKQEITVNNFITETQARIHAEIALIQDPYSDGNNKIDENFIKSREDLISNYRKSEISAKESLADLIQTIQSLKQEKTDLQTSYSSSGKVKEKNVFSLSSLFPTKQKKPENHDDKYFVILTKDRLFPRVQIKNTRQVPTDRSQKSPRFKMNTIPENDVLDTEKQKESGKPETKPIKRPAMLYFFKSEEDYIDITENNNYRA